MWFVIGRGKKGGGGCGGGKGGKCKMMMMGMMMMLKMKLIGNVVLSLSYFFVFTLFTYRFAVQNFKITLDYDKI